MTVVGNPAPVGRPALALAMRIASGLAMDVSDSLRREPSGESRRRAFRLASDLGELAERVKLMTAAEASKSRAGGR